jgi:hypothetical protein
MNKKQECCGIVTVGWCLRSTETDVFVIKSFSAFPSVEWLEICTSSATTNFLSKLSAANLCVSGLIPLQRAVFTSPNNAVSTFAIVDLPVPLVSE